ncbi:MAG: rod shape-determining protein RodA [Clostridiales bacterium]|nr:rod shape-determining protein RodA [Clostridiales bacterium]
MYFIEERTKKTIFKNFDIKLFLPVLVLAIFGMFILKSATLVRVNSGPRMVFVQGMCLVVGAIASVIISCFDYREINILVKIAYVLSCILLLVVLVLGLGDQYGSRSWIKIAGFSLQPAEFAKITFVLVVSQCLAKLKEKNVVLLKDLIPLLVYTLIPIILVVLQRDLGTTCVFLAIFFVLLFVYGLDLKYIAGIAGLGIALIPIAWFFFLNEKRKDRIRVFLNPELDPLGSGLNVLRSKMTIGSGRLFGKGLFNGIQTQNSAVPVNESDFIFSVIGEETGFIVSALVVIAFLYIILRCIYIAQKSEDTYGKFLSMGFVAMIGVHFVENVGMTIGLLPVTGIPLPFISQGGSSMLANFTAIGFLLSVYRNRKLT